MRAARIPASRPPKPTVRLIRGFTSTMPNESRRTAWWKSRSVLPSVPVTAYSLRCRTFASTGIAVFAA